MNDPLFNAPRPSFWNRHHVTLKALTICILGLLLLIPAAMVSNLVREREDRNTEAITEISSKWGNAQWLVGPFIAVPYNEVVQEKGVKTSVVKRYAYFMPESLNLKGHLAPSTRKRGLFQATVYKADLNINAIFNDASFAKMNQQQPLNWNEARLCLGLSDLKGIKNNVTVNWNGTVFPFEPGISAPDIMQSGLSMPLPQPFKPSLNSLNIDLILNGAQTFYTYPIGKTTSIHLNSSWPSPKFTGAFLPDPSAKVTKSGFEAHYKVLHLNRNFPQAWFNNDFGIEETAFGVELFQPIGAYQKTNRALKYAIMFIGLTFLAFFLLEVLSQSKIHPIQYLLIGLALCIFYTLLLSISEYIGFNGAYAISAFATIALIGLYVKGARLPSRSVMLIIGILAVLYGYLFVLLQLEDFALLFGSIGLFVAMALTMYFTRNINWFATRNSDQL